jgi:hypothetical protein
MKKSIIQIHMVTIEVTDADVVREFEQEILTPSEAELNNSVRKWMNKYRHAMDLSTKFKFKILSSRLRGYCCN